MKNPPSVSWPARICRAPTHITAAPTTPRSTVEDRPRTEVAVRVLSTFAEDAGDTLAEHGLLAPFGLVALHHADAAEGLREAAHHLRLDLATAP